MKPRHGRLMMILGLCLALLVKPVFAAKQAETITVGSKSFTESVILGEMLRLLV